MVRIPIFWRSRQRRPAPTTKPIKPAPAIEPIGPDLAVGAGFLIESGSDGLRLHTPQVSLPADRLAAVILEHVKGRTTLGYRELTPDSSPAGRDAYDLHWSAQSSGGLSDKSAKARLEAVAESNLPLDRQLADAQFELVSEGIWRYSGDDMTITAVLRGGVANFYTPAAEFGMEDLIRTSQISGVVQVPGDSGRADQPRAALRLNGEWLSYTLVGPVVFPQDAEMTRAVTPAEIGLPEVAESTEPSGFVVGGENETGLILGLTELNGRPIQEIAAWMRPFDHERASEPVDYNRSQEGFLGQSDDLLKTMARDNDVVRRLGLTHADLGTTVRMATWASAGFDVSNYLGPDGGRYGIERFNTMGSQSSPFQDGTGGSADYRVTNEQTKSAVDLSDLGGAMISRYGFYEGPGSPYRAAPEDIIRTFTHLAEKAGGKAEIKKVVAEVDAYYSAADAIGRSSTASDGRSTAPGAVKPVGHGAVTRPTAGQDRASGSANSLRRER